MIEPEASVLLSIVIWLYMSIVIAMVLWPGSFWAKITGNVFCAEIGVRQGVASSPAVQEQLDMRGGIHNKFRIGGLLGINRISIFVRQEASISVRIQRSPARKRRILPKTIV